MNTLQAKKLSFAYPGQPPLFSQLEFSIKSGERVELRAPSGRGKTTLCKLLAGYLPPSIGTISLNNEPLPTKGTSPVQLIGQHPETAIDPRLRLRSTLNEAGIIDEGFLGRLGIKPEWLARYPHELSGGELQRFCIARALMCNPQFLVADEITTMLDALTQVQIWNILLSESEAKGFGIILVTHSRALSNRIATRVIAL